MRFVELSHTIHDGLVTMPGMPVPAISAHLTREASRGVYAPGTEFELQQIALAANTGTYLDTPLHRYADGADLAHLPLERVVAVPAEVIAAPSRRRGISAADLEGRPIGGRAVLLHTGWDRHFGTDRYAEPAPYLTEEGARLLVELGAAIVGIDSINIDDMSADAGGRRPAHTLLLAAGIPIVEHLTGLDGLPATGAAFTAVPPRIEGLGTFPVRAFATLP